MSDSLLLIVAGKVSMTGMKQRYVKHSLYSPGIPHGEELVVGVDYIGLPSKDVVQQGISVREGHIGIGEWFDSAGLHVIHTVTEVGNACIADG